MRRLVVAGLRAHGRSLLLAGIAIAAGAAFVAGTLVVGDTLRASVERVVAGGAARVDVVVATTNRLQPLTDAVVARIGSVPGVRSAEGLVTGEVTVLGAGGRPVAEAPVGFSVTARTLLVAGRAPVSDGEVLLTDKSARVLQRGVGDRVVILDAASGDPREYVVSGLADAAGQGETALRGGIGMTGAAAAAAIGNSGFDEIHVRGAEPEALRARVLAAVGAGPTVVTGRQYAEQQAAGSGLDPAVLGVGLLTFAAVALLVAGFVVQNTFRILVGRRTRELALARCLGASRGQVSVAVLVEAAIIGVVSSAVGTAVGVLLARALLPAFSVAGGGVPASVVTVTPPAVLVSFGVGVIATVVAASAPAAAVVRVPPVAALRHAEVGRRARVPAGRVTAGVVLCLAGVGAAVAGLVSSGRLYPLALVGIGGATFFVGTVVLGPVVVGPLVRVVGVPVARVLGTPGRLGVANAARNPARATTTVFALVIGIALTCGVSVVTRSLEGSVAVGAADALPADYVITPAGRQPGSTITPGVHDALRASPGVTAVTRVREVEVRTAGFPATVSSIEGTLTPTVVAGSTAPLGIGQVALRPERAAELGVEVGDDVEILVGDRSVRLEVVALISGRVVPRMVVGAEAFRALFPGRGDAAVLVGFAPDVAPVDSRAVVDGATAQDPTVRIVSTFDARARVAATLGQATAVVSALLGLAVLISLIGVTNTSTLSVLERTRESAMLRALGMSAAGLRRMFTAEALLLGLVGGVLGVVMGVGFGIAAAGVIDSRIVVAVPWDVVAVAVLGAGAAAVVASVLPSRRAARVPVVVALAHGLRR